MPSIRRPELTPTKFNLVLEAPTATVFFDVGVTTATFTIQGRADGYADGTQPVLFDAPDLLGFDVITASLEVIDTETPQLTVTVSGLDVFGEDGGEFASQVVVAHNGPIDRDVMVTLMSTDPTEAIAGPTAIIRAGSRSVTVPVAAIDELFSDGRNRVTLFAAASGFRSGTSLLTVSAVDNVDFVNRLGDRNVHREQGQLRIEGNTIRFPSDWGINVEESDRDNGTHPHPGPLRNFPTRSTDNLVPGAWIVNNIVANLLAAPGGIRVSGDSGNDPAAASPFIRIANNTIFGEAVIQEPTQGGRADIIIIFDTSGSMGTYITQTRNNIAVVDAEMRAANIDARYGLVEFGGGSGVPIQRQDLVDFVTFTRPGGPLASLYASGGYEPGSDAILEALNQFNPATTFNFRPGSVPVLILFTDEDDDNAASATAAMAAMQSARALFYGVGNSRDGNTLATYGFFATTTKGLYDDIWVFNANPSAFLLNLSQSFGSQITVTPTGGAIDLEGNVSPTILNNIIAVTRDGIQNRSSGSVVIGSNLFQGNTDNGSVGTNAIIDPVDSQGNAIPLFVNEGLGNFYLAPQTPAIDGAAYGLPDRAGFIAVRSPLGIPADPLGSPLVAPDFDAYGQKRVDDPGQNTPAGLGTDIFYDRGAIERADFDRPMARLRVPVDNDASDWDPDADEVWVPDASRVTHFVVDLVDEGVGIDDTFVSSIQFYLRRNDQLQIDQQDYFFTYNDNTNQAIFTAVTTFPLDSLYTLTIENAGLAGVRDLAGNTLAQIGAMARPSLRFSWAASIRTTAMCRNVIGRNWAATARGTSSCPRTRCTWAPAWTPDPDGQPGDRANGDDTDYSVDRGTSTLQIVPQTPFVIQGR